MKRKPALTTVRAVDIYRQAISVRRDYCADTEFFKMPDFLRYCEDEAGNWRIKTYASKLGGDHLRRAAVFTLGDQVRLAIDEVMWVRAEKGGQLENFVLAHEASHLLLGHTSKGGTASNFMLSSEGQVNKIIPQNEFELEANIGAVFLQCGIALQQPKWEAFELARRACTDVEHVKKAQKFVQLEVFQRELNRPRPVRPRVTL